MLALRSGRRRRVTENTKMDDRLKPYRSCSSRIYVICWGLPPGFEVWGTGSSPKKGNLQKPGCGSDFHNTNRSAWFLNGVLEPWSDHKPNEPFGSRKKTSERLRTFNKINLSEGKKIELWKYLIEVYLFFLALTLLCFTDVTFFTNPSQDPPTCRSQDPPHLQKDDDSLHWGGLGATLHDLWGVPVCALAWLASLRPFADGQVSFEAWNVSCGESGSLSVPSYVYLFMCSCAYPGQGGFKLYYWAITIDGCLKYSCQQTEGWGQKHKRHTQTTQLSFLAWV